MDGIVPVVRVTGGVAMLLCHPKDNPFDGDSDNPHTERRSPRAGMTR